MQKLVSYAVELNSLPGLKHKEERRKFWSGSWGLKDKHMKRTG